MSYLRQVGGRIKHALDNTHGVPGQNINLVWEHRRWLNKHQELQNKTDLGTLYRWGVYGGWLSGSQKC